MTDAAAATSDPVITFSEAVTKVVTALESAIAEHGEAAVDLALVAYRIDAAQDVIGATLVVGIGVALAMKAVGWARAGIAQLASGDDEFIGAMRVGASGVAAPFGVVVALHSLSDAIAFAKWAAIFGHPEILIATNALKAAELL